MSDILDLFHPQAAALKAHTLNLILETNQISHNHGLLLSESEALHIYESREDTLQNLGRVEFGQDLASKIISYFCSSPFLNQNNYASTICDLLDAFYQVKNETREDIGDDDLIVKMRELFDQPCQGSMELLVGRELPLLAASIRSGQYYGRLSADVDEV